MIFKRNKSLFKRDSGRPMREVAYFLLDILYNAVIIVVLVILIRSFLISPFRVIGSSMANTLSSKEFILIDKLSYHLGEPKRGDPIVFLPPITNKYSHKFEESVQTDGNGIGELKIKDLRTEKQVFYCQNKLVKPLWFCQDKVNANDLVYYRSFFINQTGEDLTWKQALKKQVSKAEVKDGVVSIEAEPNKDYLVRIYNATGPEYFVKRIIGIPGDRIRIENGRVYLQTPESDDFEEIEEIYLNAQNQFHTYFKRTPDSNEFVIPEGHYFVLGDNRNHSNDSRHWTTPLDELPSPYVSVDDISGRVLMVLWPPTNLRVIDAAVLE